MRRDCRVRASRALAKSAEVLIEVGCFARCRKTMATRTPPFQPTGLPGKLARRVQHSSKKKSRRVGTRANDNVDDKDASTAQTRSTKGQDARCQYALL